MNATGEQSMHKSPFNIVAGGQTGADRAALDWAIAQGVRHGGWGPKGRRAAAGIIPRRYRLRGTRDSSVRAGHIDAEPSACSRPSTEMNRCPACLPVTDRSSPSQAFIPDLRFGKSGNHIRMETKAMPEFRKSAGAFTSSFC